ncbi:MAG: TraR/DksA family transcriptional regulator [Roseiflexaceae bacterium]
MNSLEQQCRVKLEEERESIVGYLRIPAATDKRGIRDLNEQHAMEQMELKLRCIERALQRLAEAPFGICQGCCGPIDAERLLARPFAELCIDCQRCQERIPSGRYWSDRLSGAAL